MSKEVSRRGPALLAAAVLFGATGLVVGHASAWKLHYDGLPFFFFYLQTTAGSILVGALALIPRRTRLFGLAILLGLVCFHVASYTGWYVGRVLGPMG